MADSGEGFLLGWADSLTRGWVNSWSIAAIPPLRRTRAGRGPSQQVARDIFVTVWLSLAVIGISLPTVFSPPWFIRVIATLGLYRALDLLVTFFRAGVFLSFRGDIDLKSEPFWRIQRILLATFMNFLELILWYAAIYRHASSVALATTGDATFEAINASFSTMTTLGNAIAPQTWMMTALVAAQWFTSILMFVVVLSSLLTFLTSEQKDKIAANAASPATGWLKPLVTTTALLGVFYGLLGFV